MCLILFSWDNHPKYKLILAANRDEFYERPTESLHEWEGDAHLLAGKDLTGGGTWMGIHGENRFAAITNHRNPQRVISNAPSRGDLTLDFLKGNQTEKDYFEERKPLLERYNGFNLLVGSFHQMGYFNNVDGKYHSLKPGHYGLSNAVLDTHWPKLKKAKSSFVDVVERGAFQAEDFFQILQDSTLAPDDELPQTGVSYEWEKAVSAICIKTPTYGTCCSTFITVTHEGEGQIMELSYPVGNRTAGLKQYQFDWSMFK